MRTALYRDCSYFDEPSRSQAITVTRISSEIPNIKAALDSRMMQMVNNVVAFLFLLASAVFESWRIGLLSLAIFSLLVVAEVIAANKIQSLTNAAVENDLSGQFAVEAVEDVRTIQLLTREEYFASEYQSVLRKAIESYKRSGPYEAFLFSVTSFFMFFCDIASFGLGIYLLYIDVAGPSEVYMSSMAISCAGFAIMMIAGNLNTFVLASPASDVIFRIIRADSDTTDVNLGTKPEIKGKIRLSNIRFAYPSRPKQEILKGLSFSANEGQSIALVGASGCGKSTVISILERFYCETGGSVSIDHIPIKSISVRHLRDRMSLVGQQPVLFSGTIEENVLLGMSGKTIEDVRRACAMANAKDFIEALPEGYSTDVGERGSKLSGGQKQRIAIARALVREPKILLLDEATSALDAESERAVQKALDVASEGRTCLIVAHRLSSIQFADQILFIEDGDVIERGTHFELLQLNGKYAELIRKQDLKS
ncbi:hypothetical protein AB6A40_006812 [Gnathostoma spinigerum]|uniref:ABC transporter, ATP-binding protein n=1 Tax=Gnathostoma spinigerum TaxID=75299 RepID=A0ABD6EJN3_9BILA